VKIDPEDFRRHYSSLGDDALRAIDRDDLVDVARRIYDEEFARRGLTLDEPDDPLAVEDEHVFGFEIEENWLEDAACAYSSEIKKQGDDATQRMLQARDILISAGIPAELNYRKDEHEGHGAWEVCEVLVPSNLIMYAGSVIEKEIFNPEVEEAWRAYFSSLSDEEFRSADRELLFAGLADRLERAKRAYKDEVARRASAANV
jgi:hypothetical protein